MEISVAFVGVFTYTVLRTCHEEMFFSFGMAVSAAFAAMLFLVQ